MRKFLNSSIGFVLVLLLTSCLGTQKIPATIRETGIKINQHSITKERLNSLPDGLWAQQDMGHFEEKISADVLGNHEPEILVPVTRRKGLLGTTSELQIYDLKENLLKTLPAAGYLSFFQAVNLDDEPKKELVFYNYPSPLGKDIEIFKASGLPLQSWPSPFKGFFDIIDWEGAPHLISLVEDAFVVFNLEGVEIARLKVTNAHYFRHIRAKFLANGDLVVLISGSGYRPYHMICVFSSNLELIYQEIGTGHAQGLLTASDKPNEFLVWQDRKYLKYAGLR